MVDLIILTFMIEDELITLIKPSEWEFRNPYQLMRWDLARRVVKLFLVSPWSLQRWSNLTHIWQAGRWTLFEAPGRQKNVVPRFCLFEFGRYFKPTLLVDFFVECVFGKEMWIFEIWMCLVEETWNFLKKVKVFADWVNLSMVCNLALQTDLRNVCFQNAPLGAILCPKPGIWILSIGEAAATFGTQDCSVLALKMGSYLSNEKNPGCLGI